MTKNLTYEDQLRNSIIELQVMINELVFPLESIAHLQHKERELLPLCDKARNLVESKKINKLLEH